ncbi:hypothetical protein Tco_0265305 [Tanacetum coccineum]
METLLGPKPTNGFGPNYPLIPTAVASVGLGLMNVEKDGGWRWRDMMELECAPSYHTVSVRLRAPLVFKVGLGLMKVEKDGGWRWRDVMEVELELPLSVCLVFSTCVV